MRAFVQRPLAFVIVGLAAVLSGRVFAQSDSAPGATTPAEAPEEVTVRGRKTLTQYRLELERARDEIFEIYNKANQGDDNDITCRDERPTGSRMPQTVCRSNAENAADAGASRNFLNALLMSSGSFRSPAGPPGTALPGGSQVNANIGTGAAQGDGASGAADALAKFETEWNRLLGENRQLYRAVVKYAELEDEYARARGVTTAPTEQDLTVVIEEAPAQPSGPQCEATTLTEYFQRNKVAHVEGTVSVANCSAGTAGSFTLVARVRDENGEIKPIEFSETWQREDAQDHPFNSDYPIGENVELMNVRVRGLKCTCAGPAQAALP
jgi:hypothetical protein